MKAYSIDLRERIVAAVAGGMGKTAAARTFAVSVGSVQRYVKQAATEGSLAPKPTPGRRAKIAVADVPALQAARLADGDATLAQIGAAWATDHEAVSVATLSRTFTRLKITRKKK